MSVVDKIYEAAFAPELWPVALGEIARLTSAPSAALIIVDPRLPPLYASTPNLEDFCRAFAASPYWYDNPRLKRAVRQNYSGFMEQGQFTTDEQRQTEFTEPDLYGVGAGWQAGTTIQMPNGEIVVFNFMRPAELDTFSTAEIALLDSLRPHLARTSLLAAQLGLQRAQSSVQTMNALGIPAAVLSANGVALATNALFEDLSNVLRPAAFGRIVARDRDVDRMLRAAFPGAGQEPLLQVRSFPLRNSETEQAVVLHLIPLHRSASDLFERGTALLAISGYSADGNVPSDHMLRGLFDLSAAEAGIAAELAAGKSLSAAAQGRQIALTTARTHLAQIFRKTGTHRQSELVALLKGSYGPGSLEP